MSKEMHEQPRRLPTPCWTGADPRLLVLDELHLDRDELRAVDKIVIAACGSSYHAGLVAKYAIERWVGCRPRSTSPVSCATATPCCTSGRWWSG